MARHRPAWADFGACEEITELFEGCPVLQGDAHQAGNYVVKRDDLRGAVGPFHPKKYLGRRRIVVDGDIERVSDNADLLGDVVATRGEGKT